MTNLAPTPGTWNIVLRRITDPREQKKLGAKSFAVVAVSALLAIGGLVLALAGISWSGWILAIVGLASVGIWVLIAVNSRVASTWTGDDLIEVLVADEGVIGQGGFAIGWDEISNISYEWGQPALTGSVTNLLANKAVGAAFTASGIDTATKLIEIYVKDYRSLKARTTTKIQRLALFGPMLGDPGYLRVGQNGRSPEAMEELLAVLAAQAESHGIPMARK